MRQLAVLVALTALTQGCLAVVGDPEEKVATFHLQADDLEALIIQECAEAYQNDEVACTPQPNALGCKTMTLDVRADGRMLIDCQADGRVIYQGFADVSSGSPFLCRANEDLSCQLCQDTYGNTVLDTCNRNTQAFRTIGTSGWTNLPEGSVLLTETTPEETRPGEVDVANAETATAPTTSSAICDTTKALQLYAQELNKLLAREGLNVTWSPTQDNLLGNQAVDLVSTSTLGAYGLSCDSFSNGAFGQSYLGNIQQCVSQGPNGECSYCSNQLGTKTCRCQRINVAAMQSACRGIPTRCDRAAWSATMMRAFGRSNIWLFSSSYTRPFWGQLGLVEETSQQQQFPRCLGSPLVLDLAGDGIQPTTPAQGVDFNLLGQGAVRTAWVQNDDALLALDRNGNGRIDSGAELFGEATARRPWENGFAALATLDSNHDGVVDARDRGYRKLLLWQDADGDGRSRPEELRPLAAGGVRALNLTPAKRAKAMDAHGTDLSLQSYFTRQDGSQSLLVDVFFATSR